MVIEAALAEDGQVASAVWLAGSLLCQRQAPLPAEVAGVWEALRLPALAAADRMAEAGRQLAGDAAGRRTAQRLLAAVLDRLPPGDTVEVVLAADGPALSLPVELIRLASGTAGRWARWGCCPGSACAGRTAGPGGGWRRAAG